MNKEHAESFSLYGPAPPYLPGGSCGVFGADSQNDNSSQRYYKLFQHSPIPTWLEDFSEIKSCVDDLKKKGIKDFRDYLETNPEEVLSLCRKVKIIEVNDAAMKLYEAGTKEELLGGLNTVFSKESYDTFKEQIVALSEGKREFQSEALTLTHAGEERDILLRLVVVPGHEQTLSNIVVSTIDISSMKRMEEILKRSEEKYRTIFENAPDAVLITDAETGIILQANKKAEDLLGMPSGEITGTHFSQLYSTKETLDRGAQFKGRYTDGKAVSGQSVIYGKSGEWIPASISSNVIIIKGTKYLSMVLRRVRPEEKAGTGNIEGLPRARHLSRRESEIMRLIASGFTAKEIAEKLHISPKTVQTHRARIMQKLNLHRVNDLVRYALSSRLVE